MGEHKVERVKTTKQSQRFVLKLIKDLDVLKRMIQEDLIESDVQRCGVEQELCFVDDSFQPSPIVMEVLQETSDVHFTTELAKFNAEINLDPMELSNRCLSTMEKNLRDLLDQLNQLASSENSRIVLAGILPSITLKDLTKKNLTPLVRYRALDHALTKSRGGPYILRLEGIDQLITQLDSTMFESCSTSFQIHLQLYH